MIAIIPARGQSKGLPRKNIRLLLNKPLIAYTIGSAKAVKEIIQVIVSTEDEEIAQISQKYGASVIYRPEELAQDETPTIDVIIHVLDEIEGNQKSKPKNIILLQPTSPLRTIEDIKRAINLYQTQACDSLISVCDYPHPPQWALKIENNFLLPNYGPKYLKLRRQELPKLYSPNGAIYIASSSILREKRTFYCERTIPYIMPPEHSIDIDTEFDFLMIECILKNRVGSL